MDVGLSKLEIPKIIWIDTKFAQFSFQLLGPLLLNFGSLMFCFRLRLVQSWVADCGGRVLAQGHELIAAGGGLHLH
jgi:hypothetical protein